MSVSHLPRRRVNPGDLKDPLEKMALEQCLNVRHKAASQVLPIGKRLMVRKQGRHVPLPIKVPRAAIRVESLDSQPSVLVVRLWISVSPAIIYQLVQKIGFPYCERPIASYLSRLAFFFSSCRIRILRKQRCTRNNNVRPVVVRCENLELKTGLEHCVLKIRLLLVRI